MHSNRILNLLFFTACFLAVHSQNEMDNAMIVKVANKMSDYYKNQKTFQYTFEKSMRRSDTKNALLSKGEVSVIKYIDSIYYRGIHEYPNFENLKFESIKNQRFFGVNHFSSNSFVNYQTIPKSKWFYTFNNSPKDILTQTFSILSYFNHSGSLPNFIVNDEYYILKNTDSSTSQNHLDEKVKSKTINEFYISKKDYSLQKHGKYTFWNSSDLDKYDSTITTYSYNKINYKEALKYIEEFIPFAEKKANRPQSIPDTLSTIPLIHLPDSSGIVKEIKSKYTLVEFWYKACAPCLANMKVLDKIKCNDLKVVAINTIDSVDKDIRKIISLHNFTFLFNGSDLAHQLQIIAYPTLILLDENNKILFKHIGYGDTEKLYSYLKSIGCSI